MNEMDADIAFYHEQFQIKRDANRIQRTHPLIAFARNLTALGQ